MSFSKRIIITGIFFFLISWLTPFKPYLKALTSRKNPQAILVLGGDINREHVGINIAQHLNLPLIVSGGSNPEHAKWLISQSGLPANQAKLDYRAQDTLSNFTTLVDELASEGVGHLLLITSKDHLPRAMAVGNVVAGSRGIKLTSLPVPCSPNCKQESFKKQLFDLFRALAWVVTGKDLKSFTQTNWGKSFKSLLSVVSQPDTPDPYQLKN